MRVLLVEDELRLSENIADALREGPGFAVDQAEDGETATTLALNDHYDLILLDLNLPKKDGLNVLRTIRGRGSKVAVLVLTARAERASIIELLNAGADDYLTKPFDLGELIARAKALIRRSGSATVPLMRFGDVEVNTVEQTVRRDGEEIQLSPMEYRVLEYLIHRPRVVVSKRELLEHMYDFNWEHHSNVVEVHVSNLRRKLGGSASSDSIETLRGRGYRLQVGRE